MGKIKKLLESELIGGTHNTDVYPITSTKAVYDTSNKVLDDYIKHLNSSYTFVGVATINTVPQEEDNIFYIATDAGIYTHFDNIQVNEGESVVLLKDKDSIWYKKILGFPTKEYLESKEVLLSEDEYEALAVKKKDVKYYTYEE